MNKYLSTRTNVPTTSHKDERVVNVYCFYLNTRIDSEMSVRKKHLILSIVPQIS